MDNPITREFIIITIITLLVLIVDGSFINYVVKPYWETTVASIQKSSMTIRMHHALLAYVTIVIGMYWFVWKQLDIVNTNQFDEKLWKRLIFTSLLWGFVTYGIFDFTVGAIFKDYPEWLLATDILWGMTMTTIVMTSTYLFVSRLL